MVDDTTAMYTTTMTSGIQFPISSMPGERSIMYTGPMEAETLHFLECRLGQAAAGDRRAGPARDAGLSGGGSVGGHGPPVDLTIADASRPGLTPATTSSGDESPAEPARMTTP